MTEIDYLRRQNHEILVQLGRLQNEIESAHQFIDAYQFGASSERIKRVFAGEAYTPIRDRIAALLEAVLS